MQIFIIMLCIIIMQSNYLRYFNPICQIEDIHTCTWVQTCVYLQYLELTGVLSQSLTLTISSASRWMLILIELALFGSLINLVYMPCFVMALMPVISKVYIYVRKSESEFTNSLPKTLVTLVNLVFRNLLYSKL
jgi:hypothetical protein